MGQFRSWSLIRIIRTAEKLYDVHHNILFYAHKIYNMFASFCYCFHFVAYFLGAVMFQQCCLPGKLNQLFFAIWVLKGTMSRDFQLLVCFHGSVSPKPLSIPLEPFQIFSKIRWDIRSSRCTAGKKWKKYKIIKVLIILFGHLWEVELTYRYIFALKFTLRSQQPDIVPVICHWCRWCRWQICHQYQQH